MTADAHAAPIEDGLREALHATAADPARSDELRLFGQFVGSWTLDWTGTDPSATMCGELHIGAWRSTWIERVNARVRRFIGRPVDGGILLLSDEDDPQLRWRFTDITPDAFRWRSESSSDGGTTWAHDEEMRATRVQDA
jgi:hypothetical protein